RRLHVVLVLAVTALVAAAVSAVALAGSSPKAAIKPVRGTKVVNTSTALKAGTARGVPTSIADKGPVSSGSSSLSGPRGYSLVYQGGVLNPNGAETYDSVDCPLGTVAWGGGISGASG